MVHLVVDRHTGPEKIDTAARTQRPFLAAMCRAHVASRSVFLLLTIILILSIVHQNPPISHRFKHKSSSIFDGLRICFLGVVELNKEITEFLLTSARAITKEQFGEEYPYEI